MKKLLLVAAILSMVAVNCGSAEKKDAPVVSAPSGDTVVDEINQKLLKLTAADFAKGSKTLTSAQYDSWKKKNLSVLKEISKSIPQGYVITITGHTCILGSEAINGSLSIERAKFMKSKLSGEGINTKGIKTVGKSATELLSGEASDSSKNRRVVFSITKE